MSAHGSRTGGRRTAWIAAGAVALVLVGAGLLAASARAAEVVGVIEPLSSPGAVLPVPRYAPPAGGVRDAAQAGVAAGLPASPRRWEVRTQDITLSRTLERWAAQAGYRLRWDAGRNFLIAAPDAYEGRFEDALQAVLESAGIRGSDFPLEACIYANKPPLVRITRQGEQARECRAS